MAKTINATVKSREEQVVHGLWVRSTLNSSGTEWENLMRLYSKRSGDMGIRFVIRENTDEKRDCDLFCGGLTGGDDISDFTILAGEYVSVTVTPKFGLFWGSAIEEAEVYLRDEWPKQSGRKLDDFHLEIRDMMGKKPSLEILYRLLPEE